MQSKANIYQTMTGITADILKYDEIIFNYKTSCEACLVVHRSDKKTSKRSTNGWMIDSDIKKINTLRCHHWL